MQQVALKVKDALDPAGGVADIVVGTECPHASDQEIEVRRSGDQLVHLGPGGWQDGPHRFRAVFAESNEGTTLYKLGPDVVNQIGYGTAVQISFPDKELVGRVSWPDVPPSLNYDVNDEADARTDVAESPPFVPTGESEPANSYRKQPVPSTENEGDAKPTSVHTGTSANTAVNPDDVKARKTVDIPNNGSQGKTYGPPPRFYRFYQVGFFATLPLFLLCAALVYFPMTSSQKNDDASSDRDIERVVDALQQVLLTPQPPQSPLGTKYEQEFLAEDLFRQGDAYFDPSNSTEYDEAVYWNTAAARLGHHDALIRLGTIMIAETGTDDSSGMLEGLVVLALGGLLSSRSIDLPDDPTRGPALASTRLGRWIFQSSRNTEPGYQIFRWISDAANADELIAQ